MTNKGFIDKYFSTNPPSDWSLESFVLEHDGPEYAKKDCLYFYKEGLQNICNSSEFDDKGKFVAKKLIDTYKEDKRKCTKLLDSHSARMAILQNRFSLLVSTAKSLRRLETQKNITRATGHSYKSPDQFDTSPDQSEIVPRRLFSQAESEFFVAGPQSSKRNHDSEEGDDTEDYSVDQTITGSKNISWIINKLFIKNKKGWRVKYGKDCNSQKEDDERRSAGRKIDAIITLKDNLLNSFVQGQFFINDHVSRYLNILPYFRSVLIYMRWVGALAILPTIFKKFGFYVIGKGQFSKKEDEEFSAPSKRDWTHFKGDRMKIVRMLKTLTNRLAELRPSYDIRKIKLYAMQSYLHEIIIYEFRLKYSEIYTMKEILRFSFPKTWKDMKFRLLSSSSEEIQEFLWNECKNSQKMTTRMIYSPGRRTKKARTT